MNHSIERLFEGMEKTELSPQEAMSLLSNHRVTLLDVREREEYTEGHLPGAIKIPHFTLEYRVEPNYPERERRLDDRSQKVIVYSSNGSRSSHAAKLLEALGFTDVSSLAGGMEGWKQQGLPVESGIHADEPQLLAVR